MKKITLFLSLMLIGILSFAQKPIHYELTFPSAVHHEAEISMTITDLKKEPLLLQMSRSSPGRYATHEFGKNIYNLKAVNEKGQKVEIKTIKGDLFQIDNPGSTLKVTYTLFGAWVDGTYAAIDETHAHLNIPAVFMYPEGYAERARTVSFPDIKQRNWKIASQMIQNNQGYLQAPNFAYFMDSPIELADLNVYSWQVLDPTGKPQQIEIAIHSKDQPEDIKDFGEMVKRVVQEQAAVFGEFPTFDYGKYIFLHDVFPEFAGDGMEHRNSTVIVQRTPQIKGFESGLLGTFSHEFFHAWNVERLRPQTLEPFQYNHSNSTDGLWFAEGFTQYYGNLTIKRANLRTEEQILRTFNGFIQAALNTPGAKYYSPIDASRYAVFADAGVSIDLTNKSNIFTSYYSYGAALALGLDLELRVNFNKTLDDYMKVLWKMYGKNEKAYSMQDLETGLATLTSAKFAADFFKQYIFGTQKSNYAKLLNSAGYELVKSKPNQSYSGLERAQLENGKVMLGSTVKDSPAYLAGLNSGVTLVSLNNQILSSPKDILEITNKLQPGTQITVNYTYFGIPKTTLLTLVENPDLEIMSFEKLGKTVTSEMLDFRTKWLSSTIKN
ncbi:MAG: M61 family peptidase [Pedobacter sp.]|nr:MAG: M61 family peptidase [Pedobacter sp.]